MEPLQRALVARQTRKRIRVQPGIFQDQNRQAAAVILADPQKYGGEEAGMVRWARLFIARRGPDDAAPPMSDKSSRQTQIF